jgi:hypothetical protein
MSTTYLYGRVTHVPTRKEELFYIKIQADQRNKMLKSASYRRFITKIFGDLACKQLWYMPQNCRIFVMTPSGKRYEVYLDTLKNLVSEEIDSLTIDLSGSEYQDE